ncbi:MAG: hypothetical protein QM497_04750 [Sulfurimonas sp.]
MSKQHIIITLSKQGEFMSWLTAGKIVIAILTLVIAAQESDS